jgi:2,4-dienoyl-CoA reductase-like NADH-dependent reductase (Old Yellow Enzyme family)/thioredoxin reductase
MTVDPFAPFRLGSLELPNRLLMAPVKTGYGNLAGEANFRHEEYYRRRAKGGVGTIIVEPLFIDPRGKEHPKQLGISSYTHVKNLKRLVNAIHYEGSLAIAHINHAGRAANPKVIGQNPEAPSEVTCSSSGATPMAMTKKRIAEVILEYAGASRRAIEAGFDAIEIQFGLGYLISQFLSPRTNLRSDEYGGSAENLYRFANGILSQVFQETGPDYPIITRISATEQTEGGLEFKDAVALVNFLKEKGVIALHVVSGSACDSPPWYYQHMRLPLGKNLEWASLVKKEMAMPVIVAGRLGDPKDIRQAIGSGMVDAVALGRPLVADPDLPRKMIENRDDDVIQCGACLQGCLLKVKSGEGLGCVVNPTVGKESERFKKTEKVKNIVIVGGGPAGIQAALTASEQGHKVVLIEKKELGGQFNLSFLPPGKEMMKRPLKSFVNRVKRSSIVFRLGQEATVEDIMAEDPDMVIIATGAVPILPSIPGLNEVLTGEDILTEKNHVGNRVLIIGGGMVGLECAEFLAAKGHDLTVIELLEDIARDMEPITRKLTVNRLNLSNVKILTNARITRFEGEKAFVELNGEEKHLGDFDSVVAAVGTRSVNDLIDPLRKRGMEVKTIGDARQPRQIYDAVKEGFETAVNI